MAAILSCRAMLNHRPLRRDCLIEFLYPTRACEFHGLRSARNHADTRSPSERPPPIAPSQPHPRGVRWRDAVPGPRPTRGDGG
jgi:hypothetical protein